MDILVLAGGFSPERNVSLSSGAMIAEALRKKGHKTALVDSYIGEADNITLQDLFERQIPDKWKSISTDVPDLTKLKAAHPECGNALIGPNVLRLCQQVDVVFLALHGGCGEDGRLPAVLDTLGVHYTGSDYLSSALAMNKHLTKILAKTAGINVPDWEVRRVTSDEEIDKTVKEMQVPIVVKVPDGGSSIGVYIAKTKDELKEALEKNRSIDLIFEQYIKGREIQMAFLDDQALPSIEIVVDKDFYNYENKYQKGLAYEKTPADILASQEKKMGDMLLSVAKVLNLSVYSRADFIIDQEGEIWFIEINTLPGMTQTSLVPQEAAAVGISFEDLCDHIAKEALTREVGSERYD